MSSTWSSSWRISSINGALLAAYFIPLWTLIAFNIMVSPIHGLYERPSVSIALFATDHLQLAKLATVRLAWLLALARMTVVAFFVIFLATLVRPSLRKSGACDEALGMALALGSVLSFVSMLTASKVGETEALRLHAAELLMLIGTAIVLLVEKPAKPAAEAPASVAAAELSLQQP
ncbi:hypothetical protein [Bradyrhizobium lablabi]|uniref:hypothetical protein n=1 Tax=Bradyrhizobium lablabi TaxID=722472 RepID=UPI001BA609D5|nr:hypothetical protein [Bradyrhizobium lablabi]MBR0696419.1 hypothetical protein [Bradyrhizobium lablabi]